MRGTPSAPNPHVLATGIIPACAGNTISARSYGKTFGDHPRVCGEHCGATTSRTCSMGSSPRVRGTLRPLLRAFALGGIIPACAGNTFAQQPARALYRDHPRVCGEHLRDTPGTTKRAGSSPRVRGTRVVNHGGVQNIGIIPACAGNTLKNPSSKSRK